jgi:ornithine cyclodeaminase/alanine dehydrogenase
MSHPTLLLAGNEIESLIDMPTAVGIVEQVYLSHGDGKVVMPPKLTLDLGEHEAWPPYKTAFNAMPAYLDYAHIAGIKWAGGFIENPKVGLPFITAMILLVNPKNGLFLAVMEGAYITALRTGASIGVCAKHLARGGFSVLGILGAGLMSRMCVRALHCVSKLEEIRVIDIREDALQKYVREMREELHVNISPKKSYKDVVQGADVICTVTTADKPIVRKDWIEEGALVLSAGSYQEFEDEVVLSADKIIVDNLTQAKHRGELARLFKTRRLGEKNIYCDIGEIVAGKKAGRVRDNENILVVPIGIGSLDIGCAFEAYQNALKQNVGTYFEFV